jgi:hypothetical protein
MLVDWFWYSLVLSILLLWLLLLWPQLLPHVQTTTVAAARERLLKPRTPADCPTCRQARATAADPPSTRIPVTPWRERKSRRAQTHFDPGVCLSQSRLSLLSDHGCIYPCSGG